MSGEYVFVGLETGTIETIDDTSRIAWISDLDPRDLTGDDYFDDETMIELASGSRGVPVSELIAAYEWRESLHYAGILEEIENHVARCYPGNG
jgi:hypothetical protein